MKSLTTKDTRCYVVKDIETGVLFSNTLYKTKGFAQRTCDVWNKNFNTNRLKVVAMKRNNSFWKIDDNLEY